MKKIVASFLILLASTSVFAEVNNIEIGRSATIASDNSTDWALKKSGDMYSIQNVSGKKMQIAVFVDKVVKGTMNTFSDSTYVMCANNVVTVVAGGTGVICDISYPGNVTFAINPFVNGATGRFTVMY